MFTSALPLEVPNDRTFGTKADYTGSMDFHTIAGVLELEIDLSD
jgi:hypothetical protein